MLLFASRSHARRNPHLALRSLVTALLLLLTPVVWAAPYAYVANNFSDSVSVINTVNNTVVAAVPVGTIPGAAAVSPDGRWAYVANNGNAISVIDTATNTVTKTVTVGNNPLSIAVSPDGGRVFVANTGSHSVSVINTATNTVTKTVTVGSTPLGVAVSPDGGRVYVTNDGSNSVSEIDTATNTVVATVPVGTNPTGLAVSRDGRRVYVANFSSNSISVINTVTNTVVATVGVGSTPYGVAVSPDDQRVYVSSEKNNSVSVIDTATNTVVSTVPVGTHPIGVAVSPDGRLVYVANAGSNSVSEIDTVTNAVVASVPVGSGPSAVIVGPGALIATNGSASGSAGTQISGTVPTLTNTSGCSATDALVESPARGTVSLAASTGAFIYTPSSGTYSGPDSFTWRGQAPGCPAAASPLNPYSNTATISLTIDPVLTGLGNLALAPSTSGQESFSLRGSAPFTHTLVSDDATVLPPVGVTITPAACGTAGHLACTLAVTAATVPGTASISMTATDTYGDSVHKTLHVTVAAPPTLSGLSNVSITGGQSGSESFNLSGTGTLSVTATSSNTVLLPHSGITGQSACTTAGNCTLTLKPAAGQLGTATVTVRIADAYGQSATGTFTVTVTDTAPTANNGTLKTNADTTASANLSATNPDAGQTLTYAIVTPPAHGTVTITDAATGAFTYTPASGYAGTDSFTFKVNDGYKTSNTATESLTVNDQAPTAKNGSVSTNTDTTASGVLSASDPDSGQTLTYAIVTPPAHGTVTITDAATGAFTYTPASGYAGTDSFTFKANDGYKDSNTATESLTVNDQAPTAKNGSVSTNTDTTASGVLSASDPDSGQTLTYAIVTPPAHGTVTITDAATGAFTYTPASGYAGTDSFTFKVNDGYKDSNTATESLTITDTAPTAKNGSISTSTDTTASGVLNASDPDAGQTLTYAIVTAPAHGKVSVNATTGAFLYTPATGYAGTDQLTFRVYDGYTYSNTATVSLTVADTAPTAIGVTFNTATDQLISGQLQGNANDIGQTLTFALAQAPAHGSVTLKANGSFSYTPKSGYAGSDAFTFIVNDGYMNSAPASVLITVYDGQPSAANASFSTPIDTAYAGQLKASNPDSGQSLTYSIVSPPAHGTVTITDATTGAFTYTPASGYAGPDSFSFKVNDGYMNSNTATVSASVSDIAPVAQQASYTLVANQAVSGQLKARASSSSQTLTYALVTPPAHGTLKLNRSTGAFTYTPDHNFVGKDHFTFNANDGSLDSNTATVSLTVKQGPLTQHGGGGGGSFSAWGLGALAGLLALVGLMRRGSPRPRRGTVALLAVAGLATALAWAPVPARAAGAWYVGLTGNVIKTAAGRNASTAGFKGWSLIIGHRLTRHVTLEFARTYYSDNPRTLSATAAWTNYGLRALYFPWQHRGALAPFAFSGMGYLYEYRGDGSEPASTSASLGIGFNSQPWAAPVLIQAELEAQHTFAGGFTDRIASVGVMIPFGASIR